MRNDQYGKLFARMWSDPKFRSLDPLARFTLCYIFAGPDTRTEGLFKLDVRTGARSVGIGFDDFENNIIQLASNGFFGWDPEFDLVLLWKSLGYSPARSSKDATGIINRIRVFHRHWMVGALMGLAEDSEADREPDKKFLTVALRRHINEIGPCDPKPELDPIQTGSKQDPNRIPLSLSPDLSPTLSRVGESSVVKARFVGDTCFVDEDQESGEVAL